MRSTVVAATESDGFAVRFCIMLVTIFVGCVALVGYAVLSWPAERAAIEQQMAQEIEQEDVDVCTRIGAIAGAGRTTCAAELALVRRQHEDRLARYLRW
ncbi:hypothetical protein [Vineibacter terrae]|uniref:hypothetical protein n=1 Tax=Vineibacter terrae TaxID=2586908 RepID=UPI002E362C32|nr:hypothetical protein [Vineibacter terrae]HEX2889300.1 hypothetical protein [Vineibacter terrae]